MINYETTTGHLPTEFTLLQVKGICPECGNNTLILNVTGELRCAFRNCPDNYAATKILSIAVPYHIVKLGESRFSMMHPLKERKEPEVIFSECELHSHLMSSVVPPQKPGLYKVTGEKGDWTWEKYDEQE